MTRQPVFKLLKAYLQQAIEAVAKINFYELTLKDLDRQKVNALAIYKEFQKLIEDKEYLGKLTIQEQHVLGRNELNYKKVCMEIDDAATELLLHKWAPNIGNALRMLDDTRLTIEDVLSGGYNLKDGGQVVKPKRLLNEKRFAKADYIGKIAMCQTILNIVRDDVLDVVDAEADNLEMIKFTISLGIGKTVQLLQQEIEDREANGPPELYTFELPKIEEPEIPDAAPAPEKAPAVNGEEKPTQKKDVKLDKAIKKEMDKVK